MAMSCVEMDMSPEGVGAWEALWCCFRKSLRIILQYTILGWILEDSNFVNVDSNW